MVKLSKDFVLLITLVLVTACASGARVQSGWEDDLDFGHYATFNIGNPAVINDPGFSDVLVKAFSDAVEPQMLVRGFAKSNDPDILINVSVNVEDIRRAPTHNRCPSYGDYYGRYSGKNLGNGGGDTTFCMYTEGSIEIEMLDVEQKRTIWKGVSRVRIDKREQGRNFSLIRYIISDVGIMFENFPLQPSQQIAWVSEYNQTNRKN